MPLPPEDSEAVGASPVRYFGEAGTSAGRRSGESGPDHECSSGHPPGLETSPKGSGLIICQADLSLSSGTESGTP